MAKLAGAVTHLLWDAFTHENARGVRMIPWLDEPIDFGTHRVGGVRLLQDSSSLVGLIIVIGLVLYGLRRGDEQRAPARALQPAERRAWILTYVVATATLTAAWWLWARAGEPVTHNFTIQAKGIAVAGLRGLAAGILCTSLALDWRLRALAQRSARRPP